LEIGGIVPEAISKFKNLTKRKPKSKINTH
jgi:hypothetical protein